MLTSPIQYISSPAQAIQYQYIQQSPELVQPVIYQQVETLRPFKVLEPAEKLDYAEVLQPIGNRIEENEKSHSYFVDHLKYSQNIPSYLDKSVFKPTYEQIPNYIEFDRISFLKNNLASESIEYPKKQHLVIDNLNNTLFLFM